MTDRSLFPHLLPDKEPTPARTSTCCDGLTAPPEVTLRAWTCMHACGHSRIPFSIDAFAEMAECPEREARRCVSNARRHAWIVPVIPERYMADPIPQWVGVLPRRR